MAIDGKRQREALEALERCIDALASRSYERCAAMLDKVDQLDGAKIYSGVTPLLQHLLEISSQGTSIDSEEAGAIILQIINELGPSPLAFKLKDLGPDSIGI